MRVSIRIDVTERGTDVDADFETSGQLVLDLDHDRAQTNLLDLPGFVARELFAMAGKLPGEYVRIQLEKREREEREAYFDQRREERAQARKERA